MNVKDAAAKRLIEWHFRIDPDLREIYRFVRENEDAPEEPIKLLEVSETAKETGQVDAFGFGPAGDIPYASIIATITPHELEQVRKGFLFLPEGWDLAASQCFS